MRQRTLIALLGLSLTFWWAAKLSGAENADYATYPPLPGERVGIFITTGDNDFVYTAPPVSSKACIDELYDVLKKVYQVQRIYWRAINEDQVLDYSLIRKDSALYDYWMWSKHINREVGTGQYGIDAARMRGMEVWGFLSLFDHGSTADMHYPKDSGPSMFEWKKRIEHPEWIPTDKYGLRKMAGPVCFEYPEARKALVDMYVELASRSKYDGILFYLYVEAFYSRFDDEFGFNQPIVDEFKKRYGVDITREAYDVHALAHLRGEYLTQFFRELKAALKPHNIKVGITLSPNYPQYPQTWSISPDMFSSGRIFVDWRRYIKEGLIDEINVRAFIQKPVEPYTLLNDVLAETRDTPCTVSVLRCGHNPNMSEFYGPRGVMRLLHSFAPELEYGYPEKQPVSAIDGSDFIAKLSVLRQMETGETPVDMAKIIAATKDSSVYVRRRAVAVLGSINATEPPAIAAAEAALDDPENAVRCYAIDTLCRIGTSASIEKIYEMLDKNGNFMIDKAATGLLTAGKRGLSSIPPGRTDDLLRGLKHENPNVRSVVVEAAGLGTHRPSAQDALIATAGDPSDKVRREVARTLRNYLTPASAQTLLAMLDDKVVTVRVMAASSLTSHFSNEQVRREASGKLRAMFAAYNDSYTGDDADWAWRRLGEALEKTGPEGIAALNEMLAQEKDQTIADHAWQILYVKQDGGKFLPITPEEADEGYKKHPRVRKMMGQR